MDPIFTLFKIYKKNENWMCSGSVVVTTFDYESNRPDSSPEPSGGQYAIRLDHCTGLTQAFIPLGYNIGTRAVEHQGYNWGMQVDVSAIDRFIYSWTEVLLSNSLTEILNTGA